MTPMILLALNHSLLCVSFQHGLSPRECLRDGAPGQKTECNSFRLAFFECKRSLVHMLSVGYGSMLWYMHVSEW